MEWGYTLLAATITKDVAFVSATLGSTLEDTLVSSKKPSKERSGLY